MDGENVDAASYRGQLPELFLHGNLAECRLSL